MAGPAPFFVRGSDGLDYPADATAIHAWMAEGRVVPEQLVYDATANQWRTIRDLVAPEGGGQHRTGSVVLKDRPVRRSLKIFKAAVVLVIVTVIAALSMRDTDRPNNITPDVLDGVQRLANAPPAAPVDSLDGRPADSELAKLIEDSAERGARIYGQVIRKYANTGIHLSSTSGHFSVAILVFAMPSEAWHALTEEDRAALSYFLESQTIFVREQPAIYSLDPPSAPSWKDVVRGYRTICPTCWEVKTGRHSARGVSPDATVLAGDQAWLRYSGDLPISTRASELRRQVFASEPPPVTWKIASLDPDQFGIPRSNTSLGRFTSEGYVYETPADRARAWK